MEERKWNLLRSITNYYIDRLFAFMLTALLPYPVLELDLAYVL